MPQSKHTNFRSIRTYVTGTLKPRLMWWARPRWKIKGSLNKARKVSSAPVPSTALLSSEQHSPWDSGKLTNPVLHPLEKNLKVVGQVIEWVYSGYYELKQPTRAETEQTQYHSIKQVHDDIRSSRSKAQSTKLARSSSLISTGAFFRIESTFQHSS